MALSLLAPQVSRWMIDEVYPERQTGNAFIVVGLIIGLNIAGKFISIAARRAYFKAWSADSIRYKKSCVLSSSGVVL